MYVYMYVCVCIYIYVCVYACLCVCICTGDCECICVRKDYLYMTTNITDDFAKMIYPYKLYTLYVYVLRYVYCNEVT